MSAHPAELLDARWLALVHPPAIEDDPDVRKAEAFKDEAEAKPDADYGWVSEYARDAYERRMAVRDSLDDKASDIIKYLGGGAGLFTLAALLNIRPEGRYILIWALPSFLCTLTSLFFAITARQPNRTIFPPKIDAAKRYADHFKGEREATAAFLGQWHFACTALHVANEQMADRVKTSIWCFFWAIAGLLLPIAAALFGRGAC